MGTSLLMEMRVKNIMDSHNIDYDISHVSLGEAKSIGQNFDIIFCPQAFAERGYNPVNQIAGYLISNDPAYISSHNNARKDIQQVERYEIIEELVRYYLESE